VRVTRSAAIAGGPAERLAASSTMQPGPLPPAVVSGRRHSSPPPPPLPFRVRSSPRRPVQRPRVDDRCGSTTRVFSHGRNKETRARRLQADLSVRSLPPFREDFSSAKGTREAATLSRDRITGTAVAGRVSRVAKLNLKIQITPGLKKKLMRHISNVTNSRR